MAAFHGRGDARKMRFAAAAARGIPYLDPPDEYTSIERARQTGGKDVTDFTPWQSLFGGALIGLSAVLLMALHGRIAGMTGILSGVIPPLAPDWQWRAAFLLGAVAAP